MFISIGSYISSQRKMMRALISTVSLLAAMLHACSAQPGAPTNLQVVFMEAEDTRPDFLPHAVLDFSWNPPNDDELLTGYELIIEHVPSSNPNGNRRICARVQDTVTVSLPSNITEYRLEAVNRSLNALPIYTCEYRALLVSKPGDLSNDTLQFSVVYRGDDPRRQDLMVECTAHYDPETVIYTVNVTLDISNQHPLVKEALLAKVFLVEASRINMFLTDLGDSDFTSHSPQENVTEVTAISLSPHNDDTVTVNVSFGTGESFFWRRPLFPDEESCPNILIPPLPPTQISRDGIRIEDKNIGMFSGEISFIVHWEPPQYLNGALECYEVCIGEVELEENGRCPAPYKIPFESLSNSDMPFLDIDPPLIIIGSELAVQIRAVNEYDLMGNWSEAYVIDTPLPSTNDTMSSSDSSSSSGGVPVWAYAVIAVVVVVTLVIVVIAVTVYLFRRYCFHRFSSYKTDELGLTVNGGPTSLLNARLGYTPVADDWEIRRDDVELLMNKPLGEGAFGSVFRGVLQPNVMEKMSRRKKAHDRDRRFSMSCIVAVKMLKADNVASSEKANFLKEIEMMKNVSGGENALRQFVVNMLGCMTVQEPMLLVLEFVSHGDLQSYLRAIRKKFTDAYFNTQDEAAAPYVEPSGAYSSLHPKSEDYEQLGLITERNLVDFARQIAAGMEYLSSLGIVHRDLACRNVLVGEGKAIKVSDFGMSRLLPPDEVYVPTSHGPLPLRWMAIEALFYRKFSTKTDVWSFGVVLWEICTMGGFPYPTMSNRDLPEMLRSGYRMDKPETCSQEVYEVMLDCWSLEAEERPNFPHLHKTFDGFLTQQTQDNYPYMEVLSKPYHTDETAAPPENDPDPTPINLDIEITDMDADTTDSPLTHNKRTVTRSVSHNQPRRENMHIPLSGSNFSLRNLAGATNSPMQDVQAELLRQADWIQLDGRDEQDMVDPRYVDSPTTPVVSRSGSRQNINSQQSLEL